MSPTDTTPTGRFADRIAELGLTLPPPPKPVAAYIPAVRTGNLLYVSGQIPIREGNLVSTGPVPSRASIEQAVEAARQCTLNALAVVAGELNGHLDRVSRIVRVGVFVCSDPEFNDQPIVANGASELIGEIFGDVGQHARAAVGSVALPLSATVELEMIVEVE